MALLNDYLELPCLQKKWVMVCVMVMHWMIFCLNGYDSVDKVDLFRPFLTQDASNAIAVSLIMSRLDYRNSTRWGLPADQLNHLQKIQNSAACIVTRTKSQEHITPVRRSLHWLPVSKQIEYKILFLTYQCAHKTTPQCLYNPPCSLLSFFSVQTEHLWVWWDTYKKNAQEQGHSAMLHSPSGTGCQTKLHQAKDIASPWQQLKSLVLNFVLSLSP